MATHLAATSTAQGQPFELQSRPTPKPGPGELLIAVKSVALNPADTIMRGHGLFISTYPTVIGFDVSGLVLEVGEGVPTSDNSGLFFQPGITRVAAYASLVWKSCDPDYGPFQERFLVPWQHAVPIPDALSWNSAATLPVSVEVPLSAWDALEIPRLGESSSTPTRGETKKEALLIWGASSSVGSMGVQSGRLLRDEHGSSFAAVYATAGSANLDYVTSLGADRVFDYKDPHVVDTIVSAARKDGLLIRHCFLAVGDLASCQTVLKSFLSGKEESEQRAKVASAPIIPTNVESVDGVEVIFLLPSNDEKERLEQFQYWLGTWLHGKLINGDIKPSPEAKVVGKGLEFINEGLDMLLQGVSCTKLVVEIE